MAEIDRWTGELLGKMHVQKVTREDLAAELGVSLAYVSMILNCRKTPKDAEERLNNAFQAILKKRSDEQGT